jgi:hypothetical protein
MWSMTRRALGVRASGRSSGVGIAVMLVAPRVASKPVARSGAMQATGLSTSTAKSQCVRPSCPAPSTSTSGYGTSVARFGVHVDASNCQGTMQRLRELRGQRSIFVDVNSQRTIRFFRGLSPKHRRIVARNQEPARNQRHVAEFAENPAHTCLLVVSRLNPCHQLQVPTLRQHRS